MDGVYEELKFREEKPVWFAMSATFGRQLKAKNYLEAHGLSCFVPMKRDTIKNCKGQKSVKMVPAISNLIFVHTTKSVIQEIKSQISYLQYLTRPVESRRFPIIVPDAEMESFIRACNTFSDDIQYFSPEEFTFSSGTKVRVIGGKLDGVVGLFMKIKNRRKRAFVVQIQGVAAVMLAEITDGYLQLVSDDEI
ncbi:MAG: UpxY family transcription antiterminator [Candidatus Aphodosoma sp.]